MINPDIWIKTHRHCNPENLPKLLKKPSHRDLIDNCITWSASHDEDFFEGAYMGVHSEQEVLAKITYEAKILGAWIEKPSKVYKDYKELFV